MDQVASATMAGASPAVAERLRRGRLADRAFFHLTRAFALLALGLVLAITVALFVGALPSIRKFGLFDFVMSSEWDPVTDTFGGLVPIVGTLITSLIALIIAMPVSFGIALFITELAPQWLKRPVGTAIELLAAIPSIIYGMWGLLSFAPWFSEHVQPWVTEHLGPVPLVGALVSGPPFGIGVFTAGLILAIMVIPFISSIMRDVFEMVPVVLKESAYGLGSTTWEVVTHVVLPYTKVGVVGGIMLGLGRALGETMAVTFVIGNAYNLSSSLFMPGTTISSSLANEFNEATGGVYTAALLHLGLILFFITFLVLSVAKLLLVRISAREGKGT